VLQKLLADREQPAATRFEALEALARLQDAQLPEAMELALADQSAEVRVAGRRVLARLQPEAALAELASALESGMEVIEKQAALALLGEIKGSGSEALLVDWLDKALRGNVPLEIQLDLLESAAKTAPAADSGAAQEDSGCKRRRLAGRLSRRHGWRQRRTRAQDFFRALGGLVRPLPQDQRSRRRRRARSFRRSAASRNATTCSNRSSCPTNRSPKGFDPVVIVTESGMVHSGIIKADDGKEVRLMTAEGKHHRHPERRNRRTGAGRSAMPADLIKKLSISELRDLVEFLAELNRHRVQLNCKAPFCR